MTTYVVLVSSGSPMGPRACSFCVEMPISAPKPNSDPSVKRVLALTMTAALSTLRTKRRASSTSRVTIASVCPLPQRRMCATASSRESTTIDKLSRIFEVRDPLVAALKEGLPAFGSCAGMILLADRVLDGRDDQQTFGGLDITVRRNAFGRQVDSFEGDLEFAVLGEEPVHAVFIRAPWVEQAGPDVEPLARIPSGPAAGRIVAVRQGSMLATAFHPEMTGDSRVHELFVRIVGES